MLSDLATAAVLGVGAGRVAGGRLSAGVLAAFLLYLAMFFGPVQQLSQVFDGYQQARVGLARISDLLRTPTSVPPPQVAVAVGELRGEVELRDVGFHYAGAPTAALSDFSLRVPAGQTVALVGATGAGKSTVVKLVARFYDATEGQVLVDGVDVRDLDLADLHQRLGVVPQEAHLFIGDIASNIAYGAPTPPPRRSSRPPATSAPSTWSRRCRPGSASRSPSAATGSRRASASSSPSPAPSSSTRACCCSTRRPPPSTRPPRPPCSRPANASPRRAPRSSSPTGSPPPPAPTTSS